MWPKRKQASCDEIPKVRDEYERLLKETLPDICPLQEVVQAGPPRPLRAQAPWQAHQRALRLAPEGSKPGREAPRRPALCRETREARATALS